MPDIPTTESKELQISNVLYAVQFGARTSLDVSVATGMSVSTCSAYLGRLALEGAIKRVGFETYSGSGKRFIVWSC
jgi:hypothetical protein